MKRRGFRRWVHPPPPPPPPLRRALFVIPRLLQAEYGCSGIPWRHAPAVAVVTRSDAKMGGHSRVPRGWYIWDARLAERALHSGARTVELCAHYRLTESAVTDCFQDHRGTVVGGGGFVSSCLCWILVSRPSWLWPKLDVISLTAKWGGLSLFWPVSC